MRAVLPTRRPNLSLACEWEGHPITVTVGFDPATGKPAEVFADTIKGGQMQASIADACVLLSIALQHGITPADLGKSLGRVPVWGVNRLGPASPVGTIVEAIEEAVE
jgi:hypothetical protein